MTPTNPMAQFDKATPPDQVSQLQQLFMMLGGIPGGQMTRPAMPMPNPMQMNPILGGLGANPMQMAGDVVPLPITPGPNAGPATSGTIRHGVSNVPNVSLLPASVYEQWIENQRRIRGQK